MNRKKVDILMHKRMADGNHTQSDTIHTSKQQRADLEEEKRTKKRQQEHVTEEERNGTDMKGTEKESERKEKIPKQEDVWANILITALKKPPNKAKTWWQSCCHPSSEQEGRKDRDGKRSEGELGQCCRDCNLKKAAGCFP